MSGAAPTVGMIGVGRLARGLLPLLARAGYPIAAIYGRNRRTTRRLLDDLASPLEPSPSLEATAQHSELLLLAVSDRSIEPLAQQLATSHGELRWRGRAVLHHSGALGVEALEPLRRLGASTAVLHPLQCFGDPRVVARHLPGSAARIEGNGRALRIARQIARDLEMRPLPAQVSDGEHARTAYHASAAVASNDLVALLDVAVGVLESTGLPRRRALEALAALASGTLAQAAHGGIGAALTGAVVRGDLATVERHGQSLARLSAADAELHRALSNRLLQTAVREGQAPDASTERRVRRALRRSSR